MLSKFNSVCLHVTDVLNKRQS